ncbi:MAG: type VI secretion system lipoprotein TssJ [Arenicella sp.]|nr:type VI secretion system lipoprotein TssJ [Arenicella sp.]NNF16551.1 type VI secretion system lipoprotein TssJ [Gammaproteobacteria bacterium]
MINRYFRFGIAIFLMCALTACASKPPEPVKMKAQIIASETLNPDRNGISKPVVVRIYQLKTPGTFQGADFFSLYRDADAVLAADLLSSQEIMMQPGSSKQLEAEFDPAARVIGVLAAFRDIENAIWRTSLALPEDKLIKFFDKRQMLVNLEDRTITLKFDEPPE